MLVFGNNTGPSTKETVNAKIVFLLNFDDALNPSVDHASEHISSLLLERPIHFEQTAYLSFLL